MSLAAFTAFAYSKIQLDAPDNLYWSDEYGDENQGLYANWDDVDDASSYLVYVYRTDSNWSSFTKAGEVKTSDNMVNLANKTNKNGIYYFYVMAIGRGDYSNSDWSEMSDGMRVRNYTDTYYYYDDYYDYYDIQSGPSNEGYTPTTTSSGVITGYGWQQTNGRWWYSTSPVGTSWYKNGWQWIDGKCYYFGQDGYMYANTTTPDGYTVNASGQWTVNGVVQTR